MRVMAWETLYSSPLTLHWSRRMLDPSKAVSTEYTYYLVTSTYIEVIVHLALMTANFRDRSIEEMDRLLQLQPNRPIFVAEYWNGWYDTVFGEGHNMMATDCEFFKLH